MTTNLQQLIPVLNKVVFNNLNSITQSELDLVNTLANACPFTDGVAVNYAQGILKSIDHTYVANNKYNCALNGIDYKVTNTSNYFEQQNNITVLQGIINLPIEIMQDCKRINIFDMYGNLLISSNEVVGSINSTSWANGIYIIQIVRGSCKTHTFKLNIIN